MSKRYSQKQAVNRLLREQQERERRRRVQLWAAIGVVVALVVAGTAGWLLYQSQNSGSYTAPPGMYKNDAGMVVGEGPKLVEIYLDYQCPICRNFEVQTKDTFDQLVAAKKIKIVYYTVAILDHASKNRYSTRAAAAAACAQKDGKFTAYNQALFANQPDENTAGPTDTELIATGRTVGLGDSFEQCVKDGTYMNWPKHVTNTFEERGLNGTPTIFVEGKKVDGTLQAVTEALGETSAN